MFQKVARMLVVSIILVTAFAGAAVKPAAAFVPSGIEVVIVYDGGDIWCGWYTVLSPDDSLLVVLRGWEDVWTPYEVEAGIDCTPADMAVFLGNTQLDTSKTFADYGFEDGDSATLYIRSRPHEDVAYTMWLLTKDDGTYCLLKSDSMPSVESQGRYCFPDKYNSSWVADNVACSGPVYSDGTWACQDELDAIQNR